MASALRDPHLLDTDSTLSLTNDPSYTLDVKVMAQGLIIRSLENLFRQGKTVVSLRVENGHFWKQKVTGIS
jgi:hypothetical protein